jgi:hypothetical protein
MTTRFTHAVAAVGAVAALAAAPLAASVALPPGVPGGPAVASAGPACDRDLGSVACSNEVQREREQQNEENREKREKIHQDFEENRPKKIQEFNDDLREPHCHRFPQDAECHGSGGGVPWGKVVLGVVIGLVVLIASPFIIGAIAAGGVVRDAADEVDLGGMFDDTDDDDDDFDVHPGSGPVVDYPVTAPAPVAAPIPAPGPAPAAGPSAPPGGDPSGLWGA